MSSPQPIFYKNVVPLSKEQHSQLYLEQVEGFEFANETNSLYIAAVEFSKAAREYPIVFGKDPNDVVAKIRQIGKGSIWRGGAYGQLLCRAATILRNVIDLQLKSRLIGRIGRINNQTPVVRE